MFLRFTALAAGLLLTVPAAQAQLNDTGQTRCYDENNAAVNCDAGGFGDAGALPRQDGRFGRDAQATAGTLAKAGGGEGGFDYTRICISGQVAGQGDCPSSPAVGSGASNNWGCTRDNVTGLVWSTEIFGNVTTWSVAMGADSVNPIPMHNLQSRCGYDTGWRVPTRRELLSLLHHGKASPPLVDTNYFPGTLPDGYWSSDANAYFASAAWFVSFFDGTVASLDKSNVFLVRLVHD